MYILRAGRKKSEEEEMNDSDGPRCCGIEKPAGGKDKINGTEDREFYVRRHRRRMIS